MQNCKLFHQGIIYKWMLRSLGLSIYPMYITSKTSINKLIHLDPLTCGDNTFIYMITIKKDKKANNINNINATFHQHLLPNVLNLIIKLTFNNWWGQLASINKMPNKAFLYMLESLENVFQISFLSIAQLHKERNHLKFI